MRIATVVCAAFLSLVLMGPVLGQTPAASPVVPDPAECAGPSLTINDLLPLIAGAGDSQVTVVAITPVAVEELPQGDPADAQTVAEVDATVRALVACTNARDAFRAIALLSSDYAQELAANFMAIQSGAEVDATELLPLELPEGLDPSQPVMVRPVTEARVLEGGQVGALVYASSASRPDVEAVGFVLFVKEGDRWLIDGVIPVSINVPATPAA